jgi:hypothetical protein
MIAPWVVHYSDDRPVVVSSLCTGAALVVFGLWRAAVRHGPVPILASGLVALWIIVAPSALGAWTRGMVVNEALWTGFGVLGLVALLYVDYRFAVTARSGVGRRAGL